jgi:hypothetical protein
MDAPLSLGIGGSLDCGSTGQPYTPEVTEIWVPAPAFYDVAATFAFSPGFSLPPDQ